MAKAFLFDLDDTIFDHQYSRRSALGILANVRPAAGRLDLKLWEAFHERHLLAVLISCEGSRPVGW